MTVREMKRFLEAFDPDSEVHFLLDDERIQPFEQWATVLGPLFSFRTKDAPPRGSISYELARDAIITDDEGVA